MEDKQKIGLTRILIIIAFPLAIILISIYFYMVNARFVATDDAFIKIGISSISPQIDGVVTEVNVKNNQEVKKNDLILKIDKVPFTLNLEGANAALASTVNQIENLKAGYHAKQAQLESAKADLIYYQKQYDRIKELKSNKVSSQSELDSAKRQLDNAVQAIKNIEETIKQQLASLDGNADLPIEQHADYLKAKAAVDKAILDLTYTDLTSPLDGTIANLYIKPGTFAVKGEPLFSIIDNNDIWVEAYFKETQLTDIKPGQKASIEIDTFPDKKFNGKVSSITKASGSEFSLLPAQNSSGNWVKVTQRIMVRIEFDKKPDVPLSSGMSVTATVDTLSL